MGLVYLVLLSIVCNTTITTNSDSLLAKIVVIILGGLKLFVIMKLGSKANDEFNKD